MRDNIPETYAGPLLRWALLLEDFPAATYETEWISSDQAGIPADFHPEREPGFCVVTITFPPGSGKPPAVGRRPPDRNKEGQPLMRAEDWETLTTKTLGRALKNAGYPSDKMQLKAVVHWRQRQLELAAIAGGATVAALGPGALDAALDAAADHPDAVDPDDQITETGETVDPAGAAPAATGSNDEDIAEAEIIPDDAPPDTGPAPSSETMAELRQAINAAAGAGVQSELRRWAQGNGIANFGAPATEVQARALIDQAAVMTAGAPA